jgi:hypothetical protein
MLAIVEQYETGQFSFDQMVNNLEHTFLSAKFEDAKLKEEWDEYWFPLENLNSIELSDSEIQLSEYEKEDNAKSLEKKLKAIRSQEISKFKMWAQGKAAIERFDTRVAPKSVQS